MESSSLITSLYVHVPFCAGKCRYCDFFSVPLGKDTTGGRSTARRVVEETVLQSRALLEALGVSTVKTAYVGGGTPSMLPREDLALILESVRALHPAEWTVEANPESLDRSFIDECARHGVTRLSVGMQSGDDACLSVLGRPGSREDNERAFALLAGWNGDASVDYISGIPGQSASMLEDDLSRVESRRVNHVSLYSLTVEEDTALERMIREGRIRPNPPDADDELWIRGKSLLEEMGFRHYEVSNFARPGKECRHNLRYWQLDPYAGIGPAAVSTLPTRAVLPLLGEKGRGIDSVAVRLTNPRSLEAFCSGRAGLWGMEVEPVKDRDLLLETLMMGLRTAFGIDRGSFARRFGRDFEELFPGLWRKWVDEGLAVGRGNLALTGRGMLVLNRVLEEAAAAIDRQDLPRIEVTWP